MIFAIFLINLTKKVIIIKKYADTCINANSLINYHWKSISDESIVEYFQKGNIYILKSKTEGNIHTLYKDFDNNIGYIFVETEDNKIAIKINNLQTDSIITSPLTINSLSSDNLIQILGEALSSSITSETFNNQSCFCIHKNNFKLYIDKNTFFKIHQVSGLTNSGIISVELNSVTDNDVKLPNLDEYIIK